MGADGRSMENDVKTRLVELFRSTYDLKAQCDICGQADTEKPDVFFAPGRVNLIGEHTDYNGGHVFPCALTIGTYAAVRLRNDGSLRFYSQNFPEKGILSFSLEDTDKLPPEGGSKFDWARYCLGVIWAFREAGYVIDRGFDMVCMGTIPNGSGLSSSASLEVLMGTVLISLFGLDCDMVQNALLGQKAENVFAGVNCGIMDQFAIAMGKRNHAIYLDTATLHYQYVPMKLDGIKIVIGNTNKKRGLGDSKYNERRSECEQALKELQDAGAEISALGELDDEQFEKLSAAISCENIRKRARHAVSENQRTKAALAAFACDDTVAFGKLMNASHRSLAEDYEVTGKELDTLVYFAWKQPYVIGARMTGAGFGGCMLALVREEAVDEYIKKAGAEYLEKIGYSADFYVVDPGDGPKKL